VADLASPEFLALQRVLAGRFSLEREIGRGGMGVVYLARDVALDRPVAIKLLPPGMANDEELRGRFLREARTAAQLSHPNIVPVHLVEERDGMVYFVMALVEGESLGERVRRTGPLPASEVVRILQEVAWALGYAHGRGVVHRDIKPDNILLERGSGRALLTDFGIARSVNAVGSATTPGMILGTLQYIAPEQADGAGAVDGRADLYSLGVTAFYALTGRLPFESAGGAKLLAAHLFEPAPPIASVLPALPARLAEIVDQSLVKDPALRWQTGESLADALSALNQSAQPMPPSIRRFVTSVGGAVMQLSLLGLAFVWSYILANDEWAVIAKVLGVIAIAPILPIVDAARGVAIAGYTHRDIVATVRADLAGSDRYTQYVDRKNHISRTTLVSRWGRIVTGFIGLVEGFAGLVLLLESPAVWAWWKLGLKLVIVIPCLWIAVELLGHALQVGPFKTRLIVMASGRESHRRSFLAGLWGSWPIRGVLALGRRLLWTMPGAPGRATLTKGEDRPTEMVLAAAADEVYRELKPEDRRAAAGIPEAVRRLEQIACDLRAKLAGIDASLAAVGDAADNARRAEVRDQLGLERGRVADRLRTAVEAMENLRLDLLKLRAGVGSATELTAAIEAAQRVGEGITYTLQGRVEATEVA
jgi:serine/threonine-protein kinase